MEHPEEPRPRLVLGLGNPGSRYEQSRHNVGFRVVAELARRLSLRLDRQECSSLVGRSGTVVLAQPMTYMNRSGYAARCLLERHGVESTGVLVVYDDVWLPLGKLRARPRGGPGGHRGMESIIGNLRTEEVPRLRLGVGWEGGPPPGVDLVEYVLDPFPKADRPEVDAMIDRAGDACELWLAEGIQTTMDRFNG